MELANLSIACLAVITYTVPHDVTNAGGSTNVTTWRALTRLSENPPRAYSGVHHVLTSRVGVAVAGFGCFGNFVTFLLLLHRRKASLRRTFHLSESRSAKSDICCFIALSVSDLCFCVTLIPQWYRNINVTLHREITFVLRYELYEGPIINTFVMSSTLLTVSMTVNRYLHLSHPMWALRYLRRHFHLVAIVVSAMFSVLFNVPRFWLRVITQTDCLSPANTSVYYITDTTRAWEPAYRWSYFAVGIVVPLCMLAYSNVRIITAVCRSMAVEQTRNSERNLITKTLICVVFFYVILVSPAELVKFFEDPADDRFLLATSIANLLQTVNFSCNFIPYMILDKNVRKRLLQGDCKGQRRQSVVLTFRRQNGSLRDNSDVRFVYPKPKGSQPSMSTDFTRLSSRINTHVK